LLEPWDIAPLPTQGDERSDDTFAAKGRAVSQWEVVEVALSGLYAVVSGSRRSNLEARRQYGNLLNFKDRLEKVAFAYFMRHCDQENEGEFERLIDAARRFSVRRNEITHSWVRPVALSRGYKKTNEGNDQWTTIYRFFLVPPTYTARKFDLRNRPEFIYTSVEIQGYCQEFVKLGFDVDRLAMLMDNPSLRAFVDKPLSRRSEQNKDPPPTDPSEG
jgi:hypothetical protein